MGENAAVILLTGPSGSGKSRLARQCGVPLLRLDDFYFDKSNPDLPQVRGRVDWDDPRSWDHAGALAALCEASAMREVTVPTYDISASTTVGQHTVTVGSAQAFVAEGIFATHLLTDARDCGLAVEPIYLDRPALLVAVLRLTRDLRAKRKPPWVLIRRGWALLRQQPALRRQAVAAGFTPLSMRAAQARISRLREAADA